MPRVQQVVIGPRVLENYHFLRRLAHTRSDNRRLLYLRNATRDQLLSLVEVAHNILSPRFSITQRHKNRLIPHAPYIRQLARVRSEQGARRISQRGSGAALATLLIPIIAEVGRFLLSSSSTSKDGK